ncbi:MAG: arginine N-succinyltransferase [Phycisphaerales bacterium JB039]
MFIIRRAKVEDVPTLLKLARMVHFINLPADRDIINAKIAQSRQSFIRAAGGERKRSRRPAASVTGLGEALSETDLFMFALEDLDSPGILGTSQIITHMGAPGNPNVSFKLYERSFFSQSLQSGTTHTVAKLHLDESGPTEIGGLILQPSLRGHKQKLGALLSHVRFHFMGLHREHFADRVVAEMMAPITPDGHNLLWDFLGRRFINLSYTEADKFCQYSREFMISLLPKEEIYLSLLPPEARAVVAQVGRETVPARRMLEKLGFHYNGFIDPFDGGPHLEARMDEVSLVAETRTASLAEPVTRAECDGFAMVSVLDRDGEFRCVQTPCKLTGARIAVPRDAVGALEAEPGREVGLTPIRNPAGPKKRQRRAQQ